MKKRAFWSSDKIVAIAAIFISLVTMIIFIRQTNIIETQNHLSVMPYLLMNSSDNSEKSTFAIDIENHGIGPAIIVRKEFRYAGKTYGLEFYDFLKQEFPAMDTINVVNRSTLQVGLAIPAGGKTNIITAGGDPGSYAAFLQIMNELLSENFYYEVEFKSIHDDRWIINSDEPAPIEL